MRIIILNKHFDIFLWTVVLSLISAILLFPVTLPLEYSTIQSLSVIRPFPIFALLYTISAISITFLLWRSWKKHATGLSYLALIFLFAVIYMGFWSVKEPFGLTGDPLYQIGGTNYLMIEGHVTRGPQVSGYFDWPGLHLLTATIATVTGVNLLTLEVLFSLFQAMLFPFLLFIIFKDSLGSEISATISVFIALLGNLLLGPLNNFDPSSFGLFVLLPLSLLLMHQLMRSPNHNFSYNKIFIGLLVIIAASTIIHLITTILILLVLTGIFIVKRQQSIAILTFCGWLFLLGWLLYSQFAFGSIVYNFRDGLGIIASGSILNYAILGASSRVGSNVPLWAVFVRFFWMVSVYVIGVGICAFQLIQLRFKVRQLSLEMVGILAVISLTVLATFGFPRGEQVQRFFLYAPFFTVPLTVKFVKRHVFNKGLSGKKVICVLFTIALLSFPTFLVQYSDVVTNTLHQEDISAAQFLMPSFGNGHGLVVFSGNNEIFLYQLPEASNRYVTEFTYTNGNSTQQLWATLDNMINDFQAPNFMNNPKVFVLSDWFYILPEHYLGINASDPNWATVRERLDVSNRIYDSSGDGHTQIYVN